MPAHLNDPLTLPCGAVLKNRIAKGAMTEGIANPRNQATEEHVTLYRRWAEGGAGDSATLRLLRLLQAYDMVNAAQLELFGQPPSK